jgi:hypothetical protein
MRLLAVIVVALISAQARADGFGFRDLATIAPEVSVALGSGFSHRSERQRATLICPTCEGEPSIDIQLGRQTDGTEERVRSGQTPIAKLEALCQEKNPSCRLTGLDVAPAVGWITTYSMGSLFASTVVILRGGDLLTIRSLASSGEVAQSNAEKALKAVTPKLNAN